MISISINRFTHMYRHCNCLSLPLSLFFVTDRFTNSKNVFSTRKKEMLIHLLCFTLKNACKGLICFNCVCCCVQKEQSVLRERKAQLVEVNIAVHKFFTDSGQHEFAAGLKETVKELYYVWDETNKRYQPVLLNILVFHASFTDIAGRGSKRF